VWKALPRSLGAGSTVHDRFQEWQRAGVFAKLWQTGLLQYEAAVGLDWEWQAMDGAMTKAPLGEKGTGPNPTALAKNGIKRSLWTDGGGIPLGLVVAEANRPDMRLVEATLQSLPVKRPRVTKKRPQHLCLDAGHDYPEVHELVEE
jgi:putative transposase